MEKTVTWDLKFSYQSLELLPSPVTIESSCKGPGNCSFLSARVTTEKSVIENKTFVTFHPKPYYLQKLSILPLTLIFMP